MEGQFIDSESCDILNWKDRKLTAMVLCSINLAFLIHYIANMNFLTLASYLLLFYIILGITLAQILKREEYEIGDNYEYISKDDVESFLKNFFKVMTNVEQYYKRVCSLEDLILTIKFFFWLYIIYYFSLWFSGEFLIWSFLNVLFMWVPYYNKRKDRADSCYNKVKERIHNFYNRIKSRIPKYQENFKTQ